MKITVPVCVERLPSAAGGPGTYRVRPLFFPAPAESDERLDRALAALAIALRDLLHRLGREPRHEDLARWAFCPDLEHHRLDLTLELRRRRARVTFLFIAFEALGRRVAFTPRLPELWFELRPGERLEDRAAEVLTRHFRDRERANESAADPEELSLKGPAWVTGLDLELEPAQVAAPSGEETLAHLGRQAVDGETELRRVGRCLDWLYPDGLDRALCRDAEAAELGRLLTAADRRPVLLLGPRQVGKTALLHEVVFQAVARRANPHRLRENVWLVSPQRLIAGMAQIGQWEQRLLAVLREVQRRDHVLYLDDLLGTYHAGVSSESELSVAHVLRPFVECRAVRLVAEATAETFRVLREKDRGFADLFHVLPVREPSEAENLRILVSVMRRLEGRERCRFGLEVLPAVLDLTRRHERGAAFPGKAAAFLGRLAVKFRGAAVTRAHVLEELHAHSGLAVAFLDGRGRLDRPAVLAALGHDLVGQPAALEACADALAIARARLNDPERPLASFLFLGPTGVGKTQAAKALARFLFGDAERLVRCDLNEFVAPGSAGRLVGTFWEPEGLLTSAIRRQPFAVVLLDEIDKAHPEVFDLLLQVLGEGRLTDALGRTADFTGAILVMTSNLGVREAEGRLGFGPGDADEQAVYVQAAEKFFRPEFFNRLDRVVPFGRLARADVRRLAGLLVQDVFRREGLVRRKAVLRVEDEALERVVDLGYDPALGARALKRAVERHLTRPVAECLAAGLPDALTVVTVYPGGGLITVGVQALAQVGRRPASSSALDLRDRGGVLRRVEAALRRIEEQFAGQGPGGAVGRGELSVGHYRYFAIRQQAHQVRDHCRQLRERWEAARSPGLGRPTLPVAPLRRARVVMRVKSYDPNRTLLHEMARAQDLHAFLKDVSAAATPGGDRGEEQLTDLLHQTALLQAVADGCLGDGPEQAVLLVRAIKEGPRPWARDLARLYRKALGEDLGLEAVLVKGLPPEVHAVAVRGPHALAVLQAEEGTHLVCQGYEGLLPVQVSVLPAAEGDNPTAAVLAHGERRRDWLRRLAEGDTVVEADPFRLLPVVRVYDEQGVTLDLRSGLVTKTLPRPEAVRRFVLAALPLPPELAL